jgi:hypothetical protein
MTDFAAQYDGLDDDELLQLWTQRAEMVPDAKSALWNEIEKRHISEQAHEYAPPQEIVRKMAPPVETFINITVLYWWLREIWLRVRCKHGTSQFARVESTRRTKMGYRSAARVELCYSYEFEGQQYASRTVRDFIFNNGAADSLAFGHKHGETIAIQLDPRDPSRSYYPSGFGWIEPLIVGSFSVGILGILLLMFATIVLPKLGI